MILTVLILALISATTAVAFPAFFLWKKIRNSPKAELQPAPPVYEIWPQPGDVIEAVVPNGTVPAGQLGVVFHVFAESRTPPVGSMRVFWDQTTGHCQNQEIALADALDPKFYRLHIPTTT